MLALQYIKEKYSVDLNSPSPIELPGVVRLDLIRWIRELDLRVGAEIGVYRAEFSRLISRANPQFKLYGVDSWVAYSEYDELGGEDFDEMYRFVLDHMKVELRKGIFEIIRKKSSEALLEIPGNSLDFVYIDANHSNPYVREDLIGWAEKVKVGGIVSGHDYILPKGRDYAIISEVNEYTLNRNIPLFILGKRAKEPGVMRDNVRSWAFIKE